MQKAVSPTKFQAILRLPLFKWISKRFSINNATGLILTIGVITAIFFLGLFLGITQDVILKEPLVNIDQGILQLVPGIRTADLTDFFSFITFLANWQSVLFASLLTLIILIRKKQIFTSMLFLLTLITTEIIGFVLKLLVARARPDQVLRLITEDSFSFPSGHALIATVLLAFLGYLLIKSFKQTFAKMLIFLGSLLVILLIALSRIYLGVHYPSDVLASIFLGCFLSSIFITIAVIEERYKLFKQQEITPLKELLLIPVLLILFSLFLNKYFLNI